MAKNFVTAYLSRFEPAVRAKESELAADLAELDHTPFEIKQLIDDHAEWYATVEHEGENNVQLRLSFRPSRTLCRRFKEVLCKGDGEDEIMYTTTVSLKVKVI